MCLKKCKWLVVIFVALGLALYLVSPYAKQSTPFPLPQFTQSSADTWINSSPLRTEDLRGKVVLIDIWTYGCWNCYRSIPWLNSLETKFDPKDFIIVGIHTPEFDHEHDREKVVKKCEEFQVTHPVMMDNDFGYWKALRNRYWPTFYVADKQGNVQGIFIGETHAGDKRAKQVEKLISKLISK